MAPKRRLGDTIPTDAAPLLAGGLLELTAGDDKASVDVADLAIGGLDLATHPPEVGAGLPPPAQAGLRCGR